MRHYTPIQEQNRERIEQLTAVNRVPHTDRINGFSPFSPLAQLQQTIGNQAIGRLLQAQFVVGRPGDAYEQEAEQMARGMAQVPVSLVDAPAASAERPLSSTLRTFFEPYFGHDLSHVRLHTGPAAAQSAQALNALAYTMGPNIFFASGQYVPEKAQGRQLLAHELTHTHQQTGSGSAAGLVQRQEKGPITAQTILPYKAGTRLTLNHLLNDFLLSIITKQSPDLAQALRAMVERKATVTLATADVVEVLIDAEPAAGKKPARPALGLRLERSGETFTLQFFSVDEKGNRTITEQIPDLKARRHEGGTALSGTVAGQKIDLGVQPGSQAGQFTLGALSPLSLQVLEIRALTSARSGSAEEQAEVKKAAAAASGTRRISRQRLQLGAGGLWVGGDPVVGLLSASWQLNLKPIKPWWGSLLQIPVEIQLQYAPGTAVLAALNSGAEASLPSVVPINVRIIGGFGGGSVQQDTTVGGKERHYLFGPTIGAGIGLEKSWFRMDLRYEHLFNLLGNSADTNALFLRFGTAL